MAKITCTRCWQDLDDGEFERTRHHKGGRYSWCYACRKAYGREMARARMLDQKQRQGLTLLTQKIKLERGCAVCGYHARPEALDFHHLPGFKKIGTVSAMAHNPRYTIHEVMNEIAKCQVLCAGCHRVVHQVMRDEAKGSYKQVPSARRLA